MECKLTDRRPYCPWRGTLGCVTTVSDRFGSKAAIHPSSSLKKPADLNEKAANLRRPRIPRMLELFRQTLDGKGAEFRVLVADLADFLEFGRIAVGLICFHAVPDLQGNALLRWCTFNRRYVLSDSKEPATGFLNQSLSFRHVLLQIGIEVFHIDFRNNVERRFSLSVYILDRHGAKYEAYNDR